MEILRTTHCAASRRFACPHHRRRLRIPLPAHDRQLLGRIELPAATAAASHMLVHIPAEQHHQRHKVVIRQLHEEREVGRITWLLLPKP